MLNIGNSWTLKEQCVLFWEPQERLTKMMLTLDAIKQSEMIFLEGYLWDEGEPKSI